MTVIMRKDLDEKVLLRIPAGSAAGDGTLYVTSHAVAYEVHRRGIYLNFVPRDSVKALHVSKSGVFGARRCRIVWAENGSEHSFEFRTRQHERLRAALQV